MFAWTAGFAHFDFATFGGVSTGGYSTERKIEYAIAVCYKRTTRFISVYKKVTWTIWCALKSWLPQCCHSIQ